MEEVNNNEVKIGFYNYILNCHVKDKTAIAFMVVKFKPLIKKYSYLLNYSDAEQDLTLAFIEIIEKIPTQKFDKENADFFILSYIKAAIQNRYIYLSKNKYTGYLQEELKEDSLVINDSNTDDSLTISEALKQLTAQQKKVIILKYFYGYSDVEISNSLEITRQSVNKIKLRALEKLRNYIS
jgi:RNA polymerase sigma factor (sigma-70 family)